LIDAVLKKVGVIQKRGMVQFSSVCAFDW